MPVYAGDSSSDSHARRQPPGKKKKKNTKHNKLTTSRPVVGFIPSLAQTAPIQPYSWAPPMYGYGPPSFNNNHQQQYELFAAQRRIPMVAAGPYSQIVCPRPGPYTMAQKKPTNIFTHNKTIDQTTEQQEDGDDHVDIFSNKNDDDDDENNDHDDKNNDDDENNESNETNDETKKKGGTRRPRRIRPKTTTRQYSTRSQGKRPKRASAIHQGPPTTTSECLGADLATMCRTPCTFCNSQFFHHRSLVQKKKSNIEGYGIFAKDDIPPNTFLLKYGGKEVTKVGRPKKCVIQLRGRFFDPEGGPGIHQFVNHCCDGDTYQRSARLHMWCNRNGEEVISIVSNRHIEKGEEICVNYGKNYSIPECRCPNCNTQNEKDTNTNTNKKRKHK